MSNDIHILYLEDSKKDFEVFSSLILNHFPKCKFTLTENRDDFINHLKSGKYDLILADYALPHFDGLSALQLKNEIAKDIPFIFISGHIGEERAIEALTRGADDYVLKQKLEKLIPAIQRVLTETEEKRKRITAENELRNSIALLNEAQEIGKMGSWESNFITGENKWSANSFPIFGFNAGEVEPTFEFWLSRIHPDDRNLIHENYSLMQREKKDVEIEYRIILPDNSIKWILSRMTPFFDGDLLVKLKGINIDITDRKLYEQKLRESEKRFRIVWEKSTDGMRITDENGIIIMANESYCKMTGKSFSELKGKLFNVVYHESKQQAVLDAYLEKYKSGSLPQILEGDVLFWNGKHAFLEFTNTILELPEQQPWVLTIFRDITEKKKMINELISSRDRAEAANKLKDAFIANISHEIRTPLNGIMGLTSLIYELYKPYMKDDDAEVFNGLTNSSNRLKKTIDMILNYSQVQTGTFPLNKKHVDVCAVCKKIYDLYLPHAKDKNLKLIMDCEMEDAVIIADEYTITESIMGLVDNAVKYTEKGFVKLFLSAKNENVVLNVIDSGIGISPDKIDTVFEPYIQEDMGYGRKYEGVGLGLSLIKAYLQLNGADISVESKRNSGTTFTISFGRKVHNKIQLGSVEILNKQKEDNQDGLKNILVVEDERINQLAIKKLLEDFFQIHLAADAVKAKEILNNNKIDLILMDISLKGSQHGLSLTSELKSSKKFSHIPIIVVTAHAFADDKRNSFEAGADEYLSKPYSNEDLIAKISNYLGSPGEKKLIA